MFEKDILPLVEPWILEWSNDYESGSPLSIKLKPDSDRVHLLIIFSNLNKQFKYEPCTVPEISDMLPNIEVFNMIYNYIWTWYIIRIGLEKMETHMHNYTKQL